MIDVSPTFDFMFLHVSSDTLTNLICYICCMLQWSKPHQ